MVLLILKKYLSRTGRIDARFRPILGPFLPVDNWRKSLYHNLMHLYMILLCYMVTYSD